MKPKPSSWCVTTSTRTLPRHSTRRSRPKKLAVWPSVSKSTTRPSTGAACLLQAGLNIAEIELSVLSNQCLKERIPDIESLKEQTSAWSNDRNNKSKAVHWRFTTNDARIKLRKLYPDYAAL